MVLDEDGLPDSRREIPFGGAFISQETAVTTPITEIVVNSLITNPADGARVKAGRKTAISGIAWDGDYGISSVEISADNGKDWTEASLGEDPGKFAFRAWSYEFIPKRRGKTVARGPRHQQDRPNPDAGADPEPGGVALHVT